MMAAEDLKVPLPSHLALWSATNARDWEKLFERHKNGQLLGS